MFTKRPSVDIWWPQLSKVPETIRHICTTAKLTHLQYNHSRLSRHSLTRRVHYEFKGRRVEVRYNRRTLEDVTRAFVSFRNCKRYWSFLRPLSCIWPNICHIQDARSHPVSASFPHCLNTKTNDFSNQMLSDPAVLKKSGTKPTGRRSTWRIFVGVNTIFAE